MNRPEGVIFLSLPENIMGTKVIDKLRIQGKSAPRVLVDSSYTRYVNLGDGTRVYGSPLVHAEPGTSGVPGSNQASRPALVLIPEPGQEVKSKVGRSLVSSTPPSSSSSVASRRLDYLQRVQQANRGLSTADTDLQGAHVPSLAVTRQYVNETSNGAGRESSASTSHGNNTLPNIQFLLRGKTVQQGEIDLSSYKTTSASKSKSDANSKSGGTTSSASNFNIYLPHQRVGHYKTSAKEVYRARHKPDIQAFYVDPRHASSAYRALRTGDIDVSYSNTVLGNNLVAANSPAYFYLGPPMSAPDQQKNQNSTLHRPKLYIPTGGAPPSAVLSFGLGEAQQRASQVTDFSLTGQQLPTPRYVHTDNNNGGDVHAYNCHLDTLADYTEGSFRAGSGFMPDIYSRNGGSPPPVSGSRRKHGGVPRCGSRESSVVPPVPPSSSAAGADPELLQQCLHVHQSYKVNSPAEFAANGAPSSESVRLKHFTQYVKKDDTCNTSLYSNNSKSKNGKVNLSHSHRNPKKAVLSPSKASRYVFDSVNSYIHFNKIYPRLDGNNAKEATNSNPSNGRSHVPPVDGFTPHCTETVLLKMMFGMNKPAPSVKSGARYSDIAVHADLDEFVVVGSTTNSLSRSTSVASRKLFHNNNSNPEQSYDTNAKRLSNSTLRRSKSNMSSSNDICVAMEDKEGEEEEEINIAKEAKWRIAEVEDEIKTLEDNEANSLLDGEAENDKINLDTTTEAGGEEEAEIVREDNAKILEDNAESAEKNSYNEN